jgi:hypothetical protein
MAGIDDDAAGTDESPRHRASWRLMDGRVMRAHDGEHGPLRVQTPQAAV